jgi:hypothetical protein
MQHGALSMHDGYIGRDSVYKTIEPATRGTLCPEHIMKLDVGV